MCVNKRISFPSSALLTGPLIFSKHLIQIIKFNTFYKFSDYISETFLHTDNDRNFLPFQELWLADKNHQKNKL